MPCDRHITFDRALIGGHQCFKREFGSHDCNLRYLKAAWRRSLGTSSYVAGSLPDASLRYRLAVLRERPEPPAPQPGTPTRSTACAISASTQAKPANHTTLRSRCALPR